MPAKRFKKGKERIKREKYSVGRGWLSQAERDGELAEVLAFAGSDDCGKGVFITKTPAGGKGFLLLEMLDFANEFIHELIRRRSLLTPNPTFGVIHSEGMLLSILTTCLYCERAITFSQRELDFGAGVPVCAACAEEIQNEDSYVESSNETVEDSYGESS